MPTTAVPPSRLQQQLRGLLVAGYVAVVVLGLTTELQPRLFWTVLLPLLPISIVLMGFGSWRRICPLAFFGEIGRKLNRGAQRRVPKWFERWFLVVALVALLAMLVMRLVATNGDGRWLSGLLVGLALVALITNWLFTGKTWCNFFCPVGLVERIYTEPRSLPTTPSSQCARCTACKSSCPDIDPENAYWRDLTSSGRRIATFSFPGLVLAFYTYYWLRHGDWQAYFDGRWTRLPADRELLLGPGLFFAPQLPALVAATLTLLVFSAVSFALFVLIERVVRRFVEDDERRRHLVLALAAFTAFSIFYMFAGAPTLRRIPGGAQVMAFAAPLLATLFLVKRWSRTREGFIRDKGALKLLRSWSFDQPPPDDAREVYGWIKAGEHAREQNVAAYANIVREMIADGLVRKGELRLLEGVRNQLGISEREHEKVLARLSEEQRDLFERDGDVGVEERAQLDGYQTALAEALLRHAPDTEIAELRRAFGLDLQTHEKVLERLRGESGILLERAHGQMERIRGLRRDLETLGAPARTDAEAFLTYLLLREQTDAIHRVLELLEIVGPAERVQALRPRLLGADVETRRGAVRQLGRACAGAEEVVRELGPWIVEREPVGAARDPVAWAQVVERQTFAADPYLRAAAVWVATGQDESWATTIVTGAREDPHPLVRDTAERACGSDSRASIAAEPFSSLATLEKMQFLRTVPLLADLDPEDLHELVRLTAEETVAPHELLCEEGDVDADDLFIIVEGLASVTIRTPEEREVAVLGPGEVVGEMSILDGSPRSATVRPKSGPLRVLRIPGATFRSRLLPRSRVSRPLLVTLAQRIRELSRRVTNE